MSPSVRETLRRVYRSLKSVSYVDQRRQFNNFIDDIFSKNKDSFETTEDIFKLFAEYYFAGKVMPIARLVEKTYGKGSFRNIEKIMEMVDVEQREKRHRELVERRHEVD